MSRAWATALLLAGCNQYNLEDPDDDAAERVLVEERFTQAPLPALDVLFVVDSTGSMAEEQASFGAVAAEFVGALDTLGLSYQLGVTTTDPERGGELVGRPWIVTGEAEDPVTALAAALAVGTSSAPPAAGLFTATLALTDTEGLNRGFRRSDAALHVIFLSDGDDESDAWMAEDPVSAFGTFLAAEADRTGRSARASAVVGDLPDGCEGSGGTAQAGERYAAVAEASGGEIASICAAEFVDVARALGAAAVDWQTRFVLQAVPVAGTVVVDVDGARQAEGWSLDEAGPAVVFDVAPAADAEIVVQYQVEGG